MADLASMAFLEPARTLNPLWALASVWPTTLPSLAAVLPDALPAFIIMILCCGTAAAGRGGRVVWLGLAA